MAKWMKLKVGPLHDVGGARGPTSSRSRSLLLTSIQCTACGVQLTPVNIGGAALQHSMIPDTQLATADIGSVQSSTSFSVQHNPTSSCTLL